MRSQELEVIKDSLVQEIIDLGLFVVFDSKDKSKWFKMKNGVFTQYFINLPILMSHPELLDKINRFAIQIIENEKISFDRIMGIPYGALPFAYGIVTNMKVPCIAARKEGKKSYGISGALMGEFKKGETVLFIEDATATAKTVIEYANRLKEYSLLVKDVIVICDTEQTGRQNLNKHNIKLHNLFAWSDFVEVYKKSPQNRVNPIIT